MSEVHFRFSPNILVRLGEELNQGVDQSLLELIKNSYDADAHLCKIDLINTSAPGGTVVVSDNGLGMSSEQIKDSWLVLGKSKKNSSQLTGLKRTPSGSKGLGRLAALRMGTSVVLRSTEKGSRYSNVLRVKWDEFESAETVDDVSLTISQEILGLSNGTTTELHGLRDAVRSEDLRKLARVVLMLTDPFEGKDSGFRVELNSPEFSEIQQLLEKKYFEAAEYHLTAGVDAKGRAYGKIKDWKGDILYEGEHDDIRAKKNSESYSSPQCTFDFWAFLLKKDSFGSGKSVNMKDVRDWLKHFGGVHIYQDRVRVSPYGGSGDDWLGINLIRTQKPEERPSTNNSIGRITLSNNDKNALVQKTDRSGYLVDSNFDELKAFAIEALEWMAKWRLQQAERRRASERVSAPKSAIKERDSLDALIQKVPGPMRVQINAAFNKYAKTRDIEADHLKRELQLYRTLSTAGITAATFAHESHGNPLKTIDLAASILESRLISYVPMDKRGALNVVMDKLRKAINSLSTLSSATLSLVKSSKRRVGRVDVNSVIAQVEKLLKPFYEARETTLELELTMNSPYLLCSEAALESIIANFINNSLNAFRRSAGGERRIIVRTEIIGSDCVLTVLDSGPGISQQNPSDIWLPGVTSDPDGTGLGLTIVRDTVRDLGGAVEVIAKGDLGGAEFKVRLPIVGVSNASRR